MPSLFFVSALRNLVSSRDAADERGIVFDEVVRGTARTLGAVQSLADGGVELFQRLPDVRLL